MGGGVCGGQGQGEMRRVHTSKWGGLSIVQLWKKGQEKKSGILLKLPPSPFECGDCLEVAGR